MFSREELQELELFLALLFPWDDHDAHLYKTVTWTFLNKEGNQCFANYATQSLENLQKLITTRAGRAGANIYVALGTQRMASIEKFSADGFPAAIRKHNNVVSFKSIYLDIDVGKKDAYATTADAFAALDDFCQFVGLPKPTMEVASGSGGIHVYWCTDKPIPLANWSPLATALRDAAIKYGLKFDPQVTVNPAGILRVPNTFNHKRSPPSKVRLYRDEGHSFPRYGYQELVAALSNHIGIVRPGMTRAPGASERIKNFKDGINESAPPVSIDDVALNCAVLSDILERNGAGDAEPLWNQAIYAAAFTDDPHAAAHELSRGDSRYTHADTEKKLDEKIAARADPKAGWPTCTSFSVLHSGCATCPYFALKKTPFHHARRMQGGGSAPPPPTGGGPAPQPGGGHSYDPLLPNDYWRNNDNHVYGYVWNPKTSNYDTVEVINYPILDAGLDPVSGALLYRARVSGIEQWCEIAVSNSTHPHQAAGAMMKGGCYINPNNWNALRNFLVAWVNHLQSIKRIASQSSYGWLADGSFAFDDKVYRADSTENVYRGKRSDPNFTAVGELKPWQDALQLIYGNMPLEAIVTSAFAAPLVELLGPTSLVMSVFSAESGVGKTTAMSLGQAVWGHPRGGMSALNDTNNSMMKKIGDLKSLPVYWDELRTKDQLEKMIDLVFSVTQGKTKAKLNKDSSQMDAPVFTTMFVVASNYGIADTVYSQTESTNAGGLRVLEIEADGKSKIVDGWLAGQLLLGIEKNYGVAGATYAAWLAQNRATVMKTLKAVRDDFNTRMQLEPKERFWGTTITVLLVGAALANHIGLTKFDVDKLRTYLEGVLRSHRRQMKINDYSTLAHADDVVGLLQDLVADIRHKNLIITETIPYGQTRGKPRPVNLVDTDISRLQEVWFQKGVNDGRMRIRCRPFNEWMRERRLNPATILGKLRRYYHVGQSKQTLGAGVPGLMALSTIGRAECYDLTPLTNGASPIPDSDAPS